MTRQSQWKAVLNRLRKGSATSWELQQLGICSYTARVSDLRKLGYVITRTDKYGPGGKRIVTYELKGQLSLRLEDVA